MRNNLINEAKSEGDVLDNVSIYFYHNDYYFIIKS